MIKFELNRLLDHREETLIAEIQRVANLIDSPIIRQSDFDKISCITSSGLAKRFGGWRRALERAGLVHRACEPSYSPRNNGVVAKHLSDDEILAMLKQVAIALGRNDVRGREFQEHTGINRNYVTKRFGTWRDAIKKAGLDQNHLGMRYTDDECFENLLTVWTHYGKPPEYRQMKLPPSTVGPKAYLIRWGTWNKALHAFVEQVNKDDKTNPPIASPYIPMPDKLHVIDALPEQQNPVEQRRDIPLSLRYNVLKRDNFRCVCCGRSPANTPELTLHVDHIVSFFDKGKTVLTNLRTTCSECNIGKGRKSERP